MGIDAFVMRHAGGEAFLEAFLQSQDFDREGLVLVARSCGVTPSNKSRDHLIQEIIYELRRNPLPERYRELTRQLVGRKKKSWMSVKTGYAGVPFQGEDPQELLFDGGRELWYGPVTHPTDSPEAHWYIRPCLIKHRYILKNTDTVEDVYIRWLCFARVAQNAVSLHWRGFSYLPADADDMSAEENSSSRNIQFGYWYRIPELFDELENRLQAQLIPMNLQQVILHRLWDTYLANPDYTWNHRRIRAESSGVSINAHAGRQSILELEGQGITHLATTIRKAVEFELRDFGTPLPKPEHFDDIILRTIIREYGALSYEFSLEYQKKLLFRAHSYFGERTDKPSQDSFPHMRLSKVDELIQLDFLLRHCS